MMEQKLRGKEGDMKPSKPKLTQAIVLNKCNGLQHDKFVIQYLDCKGSDQPAQNSQTIKSKFQKKNTKSSLREVTNFAKGDTLCKTGFFLFPCKIINLGLVLFLFIFSICIF